MAQVLNQLATKSVVRTISPIDGGVYTERELDNLGDINAVLSAAEAAQKKWQDVPLATRTQYLEKALDALLSNKDAIAREITQQMGRPISQSAGELRGLEERARYMMDIAPSALADVVPEQKNGFKRFIKRVPLGVVAIVAPWNYPYLTSVNGIFPALLAGNAVVLKHSHQTPLVADRYAEAFAVAGLPEGLFQTLDLSHDDTAAFVADPRVNFVNFTGSVKGGYAIQQAISNKFINAGLELGGKDPAYVRADADLENAVENLVDGAFFNAGQSCCGIERIYVHASLFDDFVAKFAEMTRQYKLGNPLDAEVNLGPMVRKESADFVRSEVKKAVEQGAKALIDETLFSMSKEGTAYLAPQVLVNVDHSMSIMTEENFGPVVGIMKVQDDAEAVRLMNDSDYGLTASIWTQ
ncbi:MAG: aldehyde dehydrogenase family protein, partial [Pseudomonadota bacterium]|nr:aldehyde dehydrogenase family protein [Pseudomonadota bacterium]